ncbi:MAG: excinuclease ABC subunit UvrC [Thermodesulfobacteriota bacterium]|nr:excinuclease ABC subunit UvrC [Thermodesulfobacteriota bacterium]
MQSNNPKSASSIHDKLAMVTSGPGVYVMKDSKDRVIYVGKARNLKKRLASYFTRSRTGPLNPDIKTGILVKKISYFETIITDTEKEALILESNLIKRYRPRYNVILKDDKRYPCLRLNLTNPYPNLTVVRKIKKDGDLYFGPFASSTAVRKTLKIIHKTFKLRKCKTKDFKNRSRPCINCQMGACLAPCCLDVDKNRYHEIVKEVTLFLKGRTPDLIQKTKKKMISAANKQDYEKAAVLRDKMFALEQIIEKQVAVTNDFKDRDVIGIAGSHEYSMITVLFVRSGFLLGTRHFNFSEIISTEEEMIGAFIRQYYEKATFVPKEILIPTQLEDASLLEELLSSIKGKKVSILGPKKGEKLRLVKLASQNAENRLKEFKASAATDMEILIQLKKRLKMDKVPQRIECFDISSISGTEAVAGMVVFEKGKPNKSLFRKYRIKSVDAQDDYSCMAEVLKRRYSKGEKSKPYPDMLMVDGGKGQLNIALSVIESMKPEQTFQIISIAKKNESKGETQDKIYKPGQVNPVNMGRGGELLLFLEKIRDKSHDFAISFHRQRRGKRFIRSALDSIPGVGKKRKATLLKHFKSIKKIRAATLEELSALPGINRNVANSVKKALNPNS